MYNINFDNLYEIFISLNLASKISVPLSNSVAVTTNSKPKQLQLVYPLEDTYRARYKSDYFPQSGTVRRPRYIADNASNHFITLQVKNVL
jgi:hypothetical protein